MAKSAPKTTTPVVVNSSYRAHRNSTYEWQGYKVTTFDDGSFIEEPVFKPDVIEIVLNKIGKALKAEGQVEFHTKKKTEA